MKIVCAWCGKDIGKKDGKGKEGVTHGLCQECFDKMKVKAEKGISAESKPNQNGG